MNEIPLPETVYGVDFSGARDAGRRIWITEAVPDGTRLNVRKCYPARELPDSGSALDEVLPALLKFIGSAGPAIFGCDFPFSLPACVIPEESWARFIRAFPSRYPSYDVFNRSTHDASLSASKRKEAKRRIDNEAQSPFSPINMRVGRQTYYGIRNLLKPLVTDYEVNIPPVHYVKQDASWILEVCPASTLKSLGRQLNEELDKHYKGSSNTNQTNREHIMKILEDGGVTIPSNLEDTIAQNTGGDALDSVIAADAALRAIRNSERIAQSQCHPYTIEGYIYI